MNNQEKKIEIAFFLPNLEGGGAERNVVNLVNKFVNNLDREKYTTSLVLGEAKGVFMGEVLKEVLIIDLDIRYTLGLFFKLIRYFHEREPDIFVSAFPHINIISVLARIFSKAKTKIIITEQITPSLLPITARTLNHRLIARFFLPFLIKLIYPRSSAMVCVSQGVAEELSKITHCPNKIKVIYNPITDEKICKLAEKAVSHPWFFNLEVPVIIGVGRLARTKDFPNFLRAFRIVLENRSARLVILGQGPEKDKLEQLAYKLGLSGNVAFLGFQENPYKFMKRASVFVLSSFHEGFGNVLVEAMACGTPVVSTNCISGPGEIIENGKSGILVPVSNPQALAEAILKVLNNPSLARRFSEEGKKRAEYFSVEKSVKEYEKLILELLTT